VDEFDFIHKPFRAIDLARKIESMLGEKPPVQERRLAVAG
jgi:hypothetical protein